MLQELTVFLFFEKAKHFIEHLIQMHLLKFSNINIDITPGGLPVLPGTRLVRPQTYI